jgi:hypothetical protein
MQKMRKERKSMKIVNILVILSITMIFSACASKSVKPFVTERDGVNAVSSTSDTQMTFIKKHGDADRYCAARPSDVADTSSSGVKLAGSALAESSDIGEGSSRGALSLGGRDPAVLITREIMYRACELSMNLNTDTKQTVEIYKTFLEFIKDITKKQTGTGTASVGAESTNIMSMKDNIQDTTTTSGDVSNGSSDDSDDSGDVSNDSSDDSDDSGDNS